MHHYWSYCINNKDYEREEKVAHVRSLESEDCATSDDEDDCFGDFEFDEKLMKHVSGGSSNAAEISALAAFTAQTTTTTTTTTTLTTTGVFSKDSCPRRFSDCAFDLPELSTQPSVSAMSSGSSKSSQGCLNLEAAAAANQAAVASVVVPVVAVGGGEPKRGGSLDSAMQRCGFVREEREEEPEEEEQQQQNLLQLLHPQSGKGGIIGGCWNIIPIKSEPKPKLAKFEYCLDEASMMIQDDDVADCDDCSSCVDRQ